MPHRTTAEIVLHIANRSWRGKEQVEAETRAWLEALGIDEAEIATTVDPDETQYPIRLVVRAHETLPVASEDSLRVRLRDALDVRSVTSRRMTELQESKANHEAFAQYTKDHEVTYDETGFRNDLPPNVVRQLKSAPPIDPTNPDLWPEPTYRSTEVDYLARLSEAADGMRVWDHAALWHHLAQPQLPGNMIWACNDDGLMATEDAQLVRHVYGLDGPSNFLRHFVDTVRADDLVRMICHQTRRAVQSAGGLLLRASRFAHEIDYAHDVLNPGWTPHAATGAMSGWIVHSETTPPFVEPSGNNNQAFADSVRSINGYLKTIGHTRLEWATAHDLLVTGRAEPQLRLDQRAFIADLILDLICARAGEGFEDWKPWLGEFPTPVSIDAPTLRARLIVTTRTLLETRRLVAQLKAETQAALATSVYRSSDGSRARDYPPEAITVMAETTADGDGHAVVQELATLLGVTAHATEGLQMHDIQFWEVLP